MSKNKHFKFSVDSAFTEKPCLGFSDFKKAQERLQRHKSNRAKSTLFSHGKRTDSFFTEDSKLYITPKESELLENGISLDRSTKKWDNLSSRIVSNYTRRKVGRKDILLKQLIRRYENLNEEIAQHSKSFISRFSMVRVWNVSIVAAIIFGMFTMTMIYRYLGQGVSAKDMADNLISQNEIAAVADLPDGTPQVLGEETMSDSGSDLEKNENAEYIEQVIKNLENSKKEVLEKEILDMVKGYPIEKMVPYIIEKDKIVAAFLIGIAKKESNWGKRVPVLNGQDCYNYWGYRGKRRLMGSGGHTCFNSRKDAVDTVAKRLEWLVKNNKLDTPEKMIVWKCGSTCKGHSPYGVRKWISDVNMYFKKLNE